MAFQELDEDADGKPNRPGRSSRPSGRQMIAGVGAALIVMSALGPVTNLSLAVTLNAIHKGDDVQPPPGMTPQELKSWQRGKDSAPGCQLIAALLVSLAYIPVLIGGLNLRKADGRGIGFTAAIMAMIPFSPAFLVGVPTGIWALVVLNRPEVIAAMTRREPPRRPPPRRYDDDEDYDRDRRRRDDY